MKRYMITALVEFDIEGEDEVEAFEHLTDALDSTAGRDGLRDFVVKHSDTKEVPFVVPPGAERWADAATKIRYSEEQHRAAMHDGSWWWTDGHSALRCEGEPPSGYRRIEDPFKGGKQLPKKPRPSSWGPAVKSLDGETLAHRASADPDVAVQAKFLKLVTDSAPEVHWRIGTPTEPAMAFLGDTCVALVMPFRADRLSPVPCASNGEVKP
jgi:hypothetical protein